MGIPTFYQINFDSTVVLMKRFFDILGAVTILALLWPVMLLTAIAVYFTMGSPILFRQLRPGYKGIPFTLVKFRTMSDLRDAQGKPLPDEERVTALGRFIRRRSLDELPQLLNVLKGELSLVGPRPLLMDYLDLYTPEQMRRHDAPPGITGWTQINGRNDLTWDEKFALDLWYVDNRSLKLDLKILALTVVQTAKGSGVREEGAQEFTGSRISE
jgi:sugar transferase EpsL